MLQALLILIFVASPLLAASGAAKPEPKVAQPSPKEQAIAHYNQGLEHRDKAWQYEQQAAEAKKEQDRDKRLAKANKEYKQAIEQQLVATELNPSFHEAFSSLGYAYRKVGQYAPALKAYDQALVLAPDYVEAIEYRAEAYLGLGRINEAQAAYETLFLRDAKRAAQLLIACGQWVAAPPEGTAAEVVAEFAVWVAAKEATAKEMTGANGEGQKEW